MKYCITTNNKYKIIVILSAIIIMIMSLYASNADKASLKYFLVLMPIVQLFAICPILSIIKVKYIYSKDKNNHLLFKGFVIINAAIYIIYFWVSSVITEYLSMNYDIINPTVLLYIIIVQLMIMALFSITTDIGLMYYYDEFGEYLTRKQKHLRSLLLTYC